MADDQKEKEHLAAELNALNNRTRLLHLIADENKKHLWKLLRKFFSEKKLTHADIQKIYDYIDVPFMVEALQQRSTPPLPTRAPSTDFLQLTLQKLLAESVTNCQGC